MSKLILISAAALAVGACEVRKAAAPVGEPRVERALGQEEAEKVVANTHAAFTSGDAFRIMENYAPGASMFDPGHADMTTDRATQTKWTADFVAMKPSDLVTQPREVRVLDADTIVASGKAAFLAQVGANRERLQVRYSQVFQRQPDGAWKIVHEHMSMPPGPVGPGA